MADTAVTDAHLLNTQALILEAISKLAHLTASCLYENKKLNEELLSVAMQPVLTKE